MSYASSSESSRTFTDQLGKVWKVERIGRTSGVVSRTHKSSLPPPSDIIRFVCQSHPAELQRETTIRAGALIDLPDDDLTEILYSSKTTSR